MGVKDTDQCAAENPCITLEWALLSTVLCPQVQPTADCVVFSENTIVVFSEKIPSIGGPKQFKPVLFKGKMY